MMDDIAEQQDVAKEISDAISNPVAFGKFQTDLSKNIRLIFAPLQVTTSTMKNLNGNWMNWNKKSLIRSYSTSGLVPPMNCRTFRLTNSKTRSNNRRRKVTNFFALQKALAIAKCLFLFHYSACSRDCSWRWPRHAWSACMV